MQTMKFENNAALQAFVLRTAKDAMAKLLLAEYKKTQDPKILAKLREITGVQACENKQIQTGSFNTL